MILRLPPEIAERIIASLQRAGSSECGGIMMGEHVGANEFEVRDVTIQGGGSFAHFIREARAALNALRSFFDRTRNQFSRFNYLGEWHSHPSFSVEPSATDHESMQNIVQDASVRANFIVLMIVKLGASGLLEGSAHFYLPDGQIARGVFVVRTQQE